MDTRISVVASQIVRHVERGGFLGAAWPRYVPRAIRLEDHELRAAKRLAELRFWRRYGADLWSVSERNFRAACAEADEAEAAAVEAADSAVCLDRTIKGAIPEVNENFQELDYEWVEFAFDNVEKTPGLQYGSPENSSAIRIVALGA